jgi:transcriptional regulator with XRE-family HTH domain
MSPAARKPDESTYSGRFAARLRMLREKAGLTVEEMVAAMAENGYEIAARSLYHWEQGGSSPPINALPAIAIVLKVKSPRYLLPQE